MLCTQLDFHDKNPWYILFDSINKLKIIRLLL